MRRRRSNRWGPPVSAAWTWIRRRSAKVKIFLSISIGLITLTVMNFIIYGDNFFGDNFFVASEAIHALGILVLIFKLTRQKTCSGLSLKSQELTATFLAIRVYGSSFFEINIHTLLDCATLLPTLWVIYMIRVKLRSSYTKEFDNMPRYYLVVPCLVFAILVHPSFAGLYFNRILWAFSAYLETVSMFPQLRLIQNAKMIEPFTAHYVFALGVARLFGFAHWILALIKTRGAFLYRFGTGTTWICVLFFAEMIQSFILSDFCYYYIKSSMLGDLNVSIASIV